MLCVGYTDENRGATLFRHLEENRRYTIPILIHIPAMLPFVVLRCAMTGKDNHIVAEGGIEINLFQSGNNQGLDDRARILIRDHNLFA